MDIAACLELSYTLPNVEHHIYVYQVLPVPWLNYGSDKPVSVITYISVSLYSFTAGETDMSSDWCHDLQTWIPISIEVWIVHTSMQNPYRRDGNNAMHVPD